MNKEKVALLIDAENISYRYIKPIISMTNKYVSDNQEKQLTHKLAFANWQESLNANWEKELKENAIKQKHTPTYSKGKNGTDISLVIYAMEAAFTKDISTFILVTGDSDFTDLVYKLKEFGKTVIVCSDKDIASSLKNAGNEFWEIEKPKEIAEKKAAKKLAHSAYHEKPINIGKKNQLISDKDILKKIALSAFSNTLKEKEQSVDMSLVYSEMLNLVKTSNAKLDYKKLGYPKLKSFFNSFGVFNVHSIDKKTTITYMLKLS